AQQIKRKQEIWAGIDKGWKIYEPLPQEPEEEALWKVFVARTARFRPAHGRTTPLRRAAANT
ncbi:hypothetical protein GTP90_35000, partial [Rugamonas sp. FT81W]|nr:hypothetical protein [Duganella vulcania]